MAVGIWNRQLRDHMFNYIEKTKWTESGMRRGAPKACSQCCPSSRKAPPSKCSIISNIVTNWGASIQICEPIGKISHSNNVTCFIKMGQWIQYTFMPLLLEYDKVAKHVCHFHPQISLRLRFLIAYFNLPFDNLNLSKSVADKLVCGRK